MPTKTINSVISKKYNISPYGNFGHEIQDNGKSIFVSNSSKDSYLNWLLAVDYAKSKLKKEKLTIKPNQKMPTKKVSKKEATTACGTHLKKGYKYVKGGGTVKVTPKAKPKKAAKKK